MTGKSLLNRVSCVPTWSTCQRACMPPCFTCQRACVPAWFTCQRAKSVPSSHFYVPKCQKTCQRAIRSANVSTWHVNVPNGVAVFQLGVPTCRRARQFFKHSSYEMLKEISIIYYYIKHSTLYLISYLNISSCVYRGGSRDFEKGVRCMSATMAGRRREF